MSGENFINTELWGMETWLDSVKNLMVPNDTNKPYQKLMERRKVKVWIAQSCSTLCDLVYCSPPGSFVHGILQVGILEWIVISFSEDLPNPGIEPRSPALPSEPTRKRFINSCNKLDFCFCLWLCGSQQTGKFFKRRIPDHLTCFLRNLFAAQKQQLEPDMEQQTGSKLGKEHVKAVITLLI